MRVSEGSAEHKAQNAFYLFIYPTSSLRDAVLCCNWWHHGHKVLVAGAAAFLSINSVSVRPSERASAPSLSSGEHKYAIFKSKHLHCSCGINSAHTDVNMYVYVCARAYRERRALPLGFVVLMEFVGWC